MLALAFTSIYDFKLTSLDGKAFDLAAYKGKKILSFVALPANKN